MKRSVNQSIATYVIVAIISIVTFVLIIISSVVYQGYKTEQWDALKSELEISGRKLGTGITLAIWNFDNKQVQSIMESTLQNPEVYGVSVEYNDNVLSLYRSQDWKSSVINNKKIDVPGLLENHQEVIFSDNKIGDVYLYVSPRFLNIRLSETRTKFFIFIVLLDFLLIFLVYFLIWKTVLKPLQLIEKFAKDVSTGEETSGFLNLPMVGEFGTLRNSLNTMVSKLDTQMSELKESNDRFWKMVKGFPVGLAIYSPLTGEISFINKKFTEMFGYTPEDIPNTSNWFELAYPDLAYRKEVIENWSIDVEEALSLDSEVKMHLYSITCQDGTVKSVQVSGVPSNNYVMVVFIDVTEQKEAEKAVLKYQEHLEEVVELRTQELVEARDNAEASNRSKSAFLANMSHELRTPLNSVIGFSRMMESDEGLTERQQRNLGIINRSGSHLLTLINDILEISKIEAGKMTVITEEASPARMIREIAEMMRPRAETSGNLLIEKTNKLPDFIKADVPKLRQVLLNLVANAVKFTTKGEITLSAEGQVQGKKVKIKFQVEDTGIGISDQDQKRVFDPFIQVETSGERSGTGLGLAISRQYVHVMGGELELHSTAGEGSIFSFSLEFDIGTGRSIPDRVSKEERVTGLVQETHNLKVLVADDLYEMRTLIKEVIGPFGFTILEAENGGQAYNLIQEQEPELVLVDWRMPVMDGLTLSRKVRENSEIKQPKIVMLTANAFTEDRKEAIRAGADDFMAKPINISMLYKIIETQLGIEFKRETVNENPQQRQKQELSYDDVTSLSKNTHKSFETALRELNPDSLNKALILVRSENEALAEQLEPYLKSMRYRELWRIFDIMEG